MKNNGNQILHASKHASKCALFERSQLKWTSITTYNNTALLLIKQSKNPKLRV